MVSLHRISNKRAGWHPAILIVFKVPAASVEVEITHLGGVNPHPPRKTEVADGIFFLDISMAAQRWSIS
jgi:hypothetical protein